MKIIIALVVAVSLFLVLKFIRLVLKRLLSSYSGSIITDNLVIATELIIWMAYIFWAVHFLFSGKFYYPVLIYAMIIIVSGFATWFLLKDIFAGIIFRFKHNMKSGSYIRSGDISGEIHTQHLTYLKIRVGDGQILRIPYSRLVHEVITEQAYPSTIDEHILHIRVDLSAGNTNAAEAMIRTAVLNTPWSNLNEEPAIKFIKEDADGYFFTLSLLSINRKQIKLIAMALEEMPSIHII